MKRVGRFLSAAAVSAAVLCSQAGCSNESAEIRELRKEVAELREQVATQKGGTTWPNLAPELPAPRESKTAEPCTLELAMKASPDVMKMVEKKNKQYKEVFSKEVSRMEELKAAGENLPLVPAKLPPLSDGVLTVHGAQAKVVLDDATPECDFNVSFSSEHELEREEPITWSLLAALAQNSLLKLTSLDLTGGKFHAYEAQVLMMTAGFIPWNWDEEERLTKDVAMTLRGVAENKAVFKLLSDWLLKVDIPLNLQSNARAWLRDFWAASHANFAELEQAVRDDKDYLYNKGLKREGWFMRRWINAGRGKTGDEQIRFYRTLMVQWAEKLAMPEAAEWKKEATKVAKK